MQQRSMEHEEEEEEEEEEKELVKESSFGDGHITDLAQQIARSMLEDEDERKIEHIMNELHDQSMGITASTRPLQSSRNAPPLEWRFRTCQGEGVIGSHDTPLQQKKKVAEERRLHHKNTEAYMKMLYAEILRMKIESRYTREMASLAEQEEYMGKKRLHQQQIEAYKVQAMRARVASPIDVLSSPTSNNRHHRNHLHRRHHHQLQTSCGGSGMRAVFLATHSSSQRECGGTGVFLPRGRTPSHGYNSLESKRKPACSTVLLPSRIVQALNLNVEDTISGSLPRFASGKEHPLVWHGDAHHKIRGGEVWNAPEMIWPRSYYYSHGRGGGGRTSSNSHEDNNILRLPSDWTY